MTANQEQAKALYVQAEESIYRELNEQIRWVSHVSTMKKLRLLHRNPTIKDLMIACWVTNIIRLNTFFDNDNFPQNSITKFISRSKEARKITKAQQKVQQDEYNEIRKSDDYKQFERIRSRVIAHWQRKKLPEHKSFSPDALVMRLISIFEACGGRKIDTNTIIHESANNWTDLLKLISNTVVPHI